MSNWKTTADLFEPLIERPKMTEKLLAKPPFKYLFDIITQTTKKTGFGNGLFQGEELKPDYYGEKNRKITYLNKLISLVQAMSGDKVSANPQKIVAGMDPEQTNQFLQQIHKCATSGKSSDAYVKKVLGGGAVEQPEAKPAQKKKIERPPSAAKNKKPDAPQQQTQQPQQQPKQQQAPKQKQSQPASKKQIQKPQPKVQQPKQEQPPAQQAPAKGKKKQQYSKKVQELMQQGEQQVKKQKQVEAEDTKNQNNIAMGRLGGKKKKTTGGGQGTDKIISATGQITQKQLDLVKSMIQSICQNTAPLGKSIQFINQDIQAMNKQLQFWRKQYHASKTKMQNQLKITQQALLPIYDKLGEIEDQIKDQKGKIQTAKAQIIKNDSTIRDLLMSVVTTK